MRVAKLSRYLALPILTLFSLVSLASYAELSVIASGKNKEAWTEERIRNAYTGRLKSNTVIVEQVEDQATRDEFRSKFLGKTENQLKAQWSISIFSGGRTPLRKANDQEVYEYLKAHDDAIGYVSTEFYQKASLGNKEGPVEVFKIK